MAVSLHITTEQSKIQLNIAKFLILSKGCCSGAHRIAKIQNRCSRHHRIQIDQTDFFFGIAVDQHVAVSGIVVCDTFRDLL